MGFQDSMAQSDLMPRGPKPTPIFEALEGQKVPKDPFVACLDREGHVISMRGVGTTENQPPQHLSRVVTMAKQASKLAPVPEGADPTRQTVTITLETSHKVVSILSKDDYVGTVWRTERPGQKQQP